MRHEVLEDQQMRDPSEECSVHLGSHPSAAAGHTHNGSASHRVSPNRLAELLSNVVDDAVSRRRSFRPFLR